MADKFQRGKGNGDSYPPKGLSSNVLHLPYWIKLGLGGKEYLCAEKNATFSADSPPDELPDISKHNNFMAEVLRSNPGMYKRLKEKKTSLGVSLAHCIKTGIDNPRHPFIKTCGIVAGDEESYQLFAELFDQIINNRHGGYASNAFHKSDTNIQNLNLKKLDPTGKYVLTSRVRSGRSLRGYRLPPVVTFEERRTIERVVVDALLRLTGSLSGEYFPLHGSRSYSPKPNGMSLEKQRELRACGNLFQQPDSTLLLSSGCGRHWPDARGIFHNIDKNAYVWINEEDHIRIVSMEKGQNMQEVFSRFVRLLNALEIELRKTGSEFMYNEHLGFILTCPSNIGTGLRAGCLLKIPHLSSCPGFKTILKNMGLQARGHSGVDSESRDGIVDISNADRIGKTEVEYVNIVIDGVSKIIEWEQILENGKTIDV